MAGTNNTTQIGNLVREPNIRTLPSGARVGELTIAVNNEYKKDDAVFFKVKLWNKKDIDFVETWLGTGDKVSVTGEVLAAEGWIDKDSGQVRTVNVLNANCVSGLVVKKFQERREQHSNAVQTEAPATPAVEDNPKF